MEGVVEGCSKMVQHVEEEDMKAVYVDTNLRTYLVCLVSPISHFYELKDQIVKEHEEFYPDFGNININLLKVKRDQKYYRLSENMLLTTAFRGAKTWSVFASVSSSPPNHPPRALSVPVRKLRLNMASHEPVLNLKAGDGDNTSPGKKKRSRIDFAPDLSTSSPHIHNNVVEKSLLGINGLKEGGELEPKQLVGIKDDPSKVDVTNVIGSQMRKKKMRLEGTRNLIKRTTSTSKRKKHDQPSATENPSNSMTLEEGNKNERISVGSRQLHSEVHEAEQMKVIGAEPFQPPQLSTPQVNGKIAGVKPKKKMQKKQQLNAKTQKTVVEQADVTPKHKVNDADYQEKVSLHKKTHDGSTEGRKLDNNEVSERNAQLTRTDLENNVKESELLGQIGTKPLPLHQISQHEERLNVQTVEVVKPVEKKPTFSVNGLSEVEQRDFLPTNGTSNATKVKNTDLPMSAVAELKGENLTMSASSKQVMNSQVPLGATVNSGARKLGQKNPARKSGVLRPNLNARRKSSATSSLISVKSAKTINKGENVEVQKKKNQETVFKTPSNENMGLAGGFVGFLCDSPEFPDDEVERNGSSCSARTADDSSSSDSSEGESEGESKGSQSARDEKNLNISALMDLDVASVIRRSSLYKKSLEQAALQSEMEDGETEPVVADSYSD